MTVRLIHSLALALCGAFALGAPDIVQPEDPLARPSTPPARPKAPPPPRTDAPVEGLVSVAMLSYASGKSSRCFAGEFLRLAAFRTRINVDQEFAEVDLASPTLFDHPFAIMTGEGAFELSDAELANLRDYLSRGGLLLASAGCSNAEWSASLTRALARIFPDQQPAPLDADHEVFRTIFDVKDLATKKRTPARILGLSLDGRLAVVFSAEGLNDTEDAGHGCCCCGGNEVRDAKYFNANVLAYALTR